MVIEGTIEGDQLHSERENKFDEVCRRKVERNAQV